MANIDLIPYPNASAYRRIAAVAWGDPFGSAMVTNVGVFGLTVGYAPFFPLARSPIILTLGCIEDRAVVENGAIVPGRVLYLNGTFDHRVVDGYHAGIIAKEMRALLGNPERLDDVVG